MPNKLVIDSLRAELASIEKLLEEAIRIDDPVGKLQYEYRFQEIKKEIEELSKQPECKASVALFFSGKPVLGSKGVQADFAGSILENFQDLIAKRFASVELGAMGSRGPVPLGSTTQLMVTEIARGSFGFILDEISNQQDLCDTEMKNVVDDVTSLIKHTSAPDETEFEKAAEELDQRSLDSLKNFFSILDKNKAMIRIVENERDISLDSPSVERGRIRTEATKIDEHPDQIREGTLVGFLPQHRRFEFQFSPEEIIFGSTSREATKQFLEAVVSAEGAIGKKWQVKMNIRTVTRLNRKPKNSYSLLELVGRIP